MNNPKKAVERSGVCGHVCGHFCGRENPIKSRLYGFCPQCYIFSLLIIKHKSYKGKLRYTRYVYARKGFYVTLWTKTEQKTRNISKSRRKER